MSLRELLGLNDYFGGIKRMKKTAIVSALCLSLLATGCTISQPSQESESSTTSSATTESEASSEATTEAPTETTTEASEEPTTFETFVFEKGDSLTTHNIFLSNFAEQGISLLDTRTCALTDVVRFAIYFSDINNFLHHVLTIQLKYRSASEHQMHTQGYDRIPYRDQLL